MEEVSEFRGRYVYLCEDSTEGIFTAVYDAFAEGHRKEDTALCLKESTYTTELFTTYIPVETDMVRPALPYGLHVLPAGYQGFVPAYP